MVYARVHDKTVAEDYFIAMSRVEQRLELTPTPTQEPKNAAEIVKVPPNAQVFDWIERLALPELCQEERLEIAGNLKRALSSSLPGQLSPHPSYAG
jgi:hypothetical protein